VLLNRVQQTLNPRSGQLSLAFGYSNMTPINFRKLALSIPGAVEASHGGHPDFRLHGKVFASLGAPNDEWGMVKLSNNFQKEFIDEFPDVFRPCKGAWGMRGYTNVYLPSANQQLISRVLKASADLISIKRQTSRTRRCS
jgi:hypothetical protein